MVVISLRKRREIQQKKLTYRSNNIDKHQCIDCDRIYTQPNMIPFIGTNNTYDDHTEWYCLRCYNKKFGG